MSTTIPMTPEGFARLKAELQHLKSVERPKIIAEVATAREHGDLRENAEYHAAREKHGFIEGRIEVLEGTLGRAEVIDPSKFSGTRIAFGARVKLLDADNGKETTYQIVGPEEADLDRGSISVNSPLAKQLIGREEGDEVTVKTPGGSKVYEVVSVTWG
ncbi:MAG: transcription elongation factor GreA [Myxococcales bacterium]|nr:transcription elongation factor GreA [Myxococcales bacterium]